MKFISHSTTHVGSRRSSNQDVVLSDLELGVYILCDGMGGTSGGDIAALKASETTLNYLREHGGTIKQVASGHASADKLIALAQSAVQEANSAIYSHTMERAELRGSGTTIVLLITAGNNGICAHVGDSRLYAFRNNQLLQLTKDHSLAQDLIDRGVIERDKLDLFPFKHVLSRAVGLLPAVSVDTLLFEILPGDRFLLSSDGISNKVASTALEGVMSHGDAPRLLERIVSLARQSGGDDDLSAVLVEASADDHEREVQLVRSAELVLKISVLQEMYLFQALDPQNILRIVNASKVVDCAQGSTVVSHGEAESCLYIILEGSFTIEINGQPIAEISRGNHFGEMALLTRHRRSATVRATTQGKVLQIAAEDFSKFVQSHPQDGVQMITALAKELSERLRQTNQFLAQRT